MKYQNIFFRVDFSKFIGLGHISRCLTFAESLSENIPMDRDSIHFISRDFEQKAPFKGDERFLFLPHEKTIEVNRNDYSTWWETTWDHDSDQTLDILKNFTGKKLVVVDHYSIDHHWELKVSDPQTDIFVIDDLNFYHHNCLFLLNYNFNALNLNYDLDLYEKTDLLLGPEYAPIKNKLKECKSSRNSSHQLNSILLYLGSCSPNYLNLLIESVLRSSFETQNITVLFNGDLDIIDKNPGIKHLKYTENIHELFMESDFIFGAGGVALTERVFLKVPSATWAVSENQVGNAKACAQLSLTDYLGQEEEVTSRTLDDYFLNHIFESYKKQKEILNSEENKATGKFGSLIANALKK